MDEERKTDNPEPSEPMEEEIEDLQAPADAQQNVAGGGGNCVLTVPGCASPSHAPN